MQPGRPTISRQISVINTCSLFRQNTFELSAINPRLNRLNSTESVVSESSSCSSSCDNNVPDIPKRKRVTFSLNPSLTIHEHGDTDCKDIVGECAVIQNENVVAEIETKSL